MPRNALAAGPRWGSSRRSPDPLVDWVWGGGEGGHPLPRTPRLSAPRSSRFQRSALAARRHVSSGNIFGYTQSPSHVRSSDFFFFKY